MDEIKSFIKAIEFFDDYKQNNLGCCNFGVAKCSFEILGFLFAVPFKKLNSQQI